MHHMSHPLLFRLFTPGGSSRLPHPHPGPEGVKGVLRPEATSTGPKLAQRGDVGLNTCKDVYSCVVCVPGHVWTVWTRSFKDSTCFGDDPSAPPVGHPLHWVYLLTSPCRHFLSTTPPRPRTRHIPTLERSPPPVSGPEIPVHTECSPWPVSRGR